MGTYALHAVLPPALAFELGLQLLHAAKHAADPECRAALAAVAQLNGVSDAIS